MGVGMGGNRTMVERGRHVSEEGLWGGFVATMGISCISLRAGGSGKRWWLWRWPAYRGEIKGRAQVVVNIGC
jgi:hypothetical protein